MAHPHPFDAGYADAYSRAWTSEPVKLLDFFAPDGTYTDVPMGATYTGREEIARFHRWMLKFAPDSVIEFGDACAAGGRLYLQWIWSGTFEGALRLPDGTSVRSTGANFIVPGVAVCRYAADGQLLSHRDYWDLNTLLRGVCASPMKPNLPT
jgi:SnoaL-like domain